MASSPRSAEPLASTQLQAQRNKATWRRERQWKEIRSTFRKGGLLGVASCYSLLHACAECGHELLLSVLLESVAGGGINVPDDSSNLPLARAIIGHENRIKVPASVSRLLLESNASVVMGVYSKGLYASQKRRFSAPSIFELAKNGSWPWPETRDLVIEMGRSQAGLSS